MTKTIQLVVGGLVAFALAVDVAQPQGLEGLKASIAGQSTSSVCGNTVENPTTLPPSGSGPVVYLIAPCFSGQGGVARTSPLEYLRDIQLRPSRPSQGEWVPFDKVAEQTIVQDFQRLWANHSLAELFVDIRNYRFPNGVLGKVVTFNIMERN